MKQSIKEKGLNTFWSMMALITTIFPAYICWWGLWVAKVGVGAVGLNAGHGIIIAIVVMLGYFWIIASIAIIFARWSQGKYRALRKTAMLVIWVNVGMYIIFLILKETVPLP